MLSKLEYQSSNCKNWDYILVSFSLYYDQDKQLPNYELLFERNFKTGKHSYYSTISEFCKCHILSNWLSISAKPIES